MTIIKASTRASISRGIFSFVTTRLLPAVVRQHHRSLDAVGDKQDRDLQAARQEVLAAFGVYQDAQDRADRMFTQRVGVLTAVAEERHRINAYIKED